MFFDEPGMGDWRIGAYSQNDRSLLLESVEPIPESAGLFGAAGRIVARIKIENDRLAFEVGQLQLRAVIRDGSKIRREITFFKFEFNRLSHKRNQRFLFPLPSDGRG